MRKNTLPLPSDADALLSPPSPRRIETTQFGSWRDVHFSIAADGDRRPWQLRHTGECHAIGLHGQFSPGCVAVVAPGSRLQELVVWQANAGGGWPHWGGWQILGRVPEWAVVMRPGDVLSFPNAPLKEGFSALVMSPWHQQQYHSYRGNLNTSGVRVDPAATVSSYVEITANRFGRAPQPVFRVWSTPSHYPVSLPYSKVPSTVPRLPLSSSPTYNATNDASPDDVVGDFVLVGDDVTHLTLTVLQYSGALPHVYSRVSAARDMEVWWLTSDGVCHQHPDDQWTSGGRGQVSATHDIEVYSVPRNIVGVAVVDSTANTVVHVTATDAS